MNSVKKIRRNVIHFVATAFEYFVNITPQVSGANDYNVIVKVISYELRDWTDEAPVSGSEGGKMLEYSVLNKNFQLRVPGTAFKMMFVNPIMLIRNYCFK